MAFDGLFFSRIPLTKKIPAQSGNSFVCSPPKRAFFVQAANANRGHAKTDFAATLTLCVMQIG